VHPANQKCARLPEEGSSSEGQVNGRPMGARRIAPSQVWRVNSDSNAVNEARNLSAVRSSYSSQPVHWVFGACGGSQALNCLPPSSTDGGMCPISKQQQRRARGQRWSFLTLFLIVQVDSPILHSHYTHIHNGFQQQQGWYQPRRELSLSLGRIQHTPLITPARLAALQPTDQVSPRGCSD
jgi:hypothetical protein